MSSLPSSFSGGGGLLGSGSGGSDSSSSQGSFQPGAGGTVGGKSRVTLDAFKLQHTITQAELGSGKEAKVTAVACMNGALFFGNEGGIIQAFTLTSHASESESSIAAAAASSAPPRLLSSSPPSSHSSSHLAHTVQLVAKKKIGKKAVQQMEVLYVSDPSSSSSPATAAPPRPYLLALVDSKLHVLDVHTLSVVMDVGSKDSFSLFCLDSSSPTSTSTSSHHQPRLCAQLKNKKKLVVYALQVHLGKAELLKDLLVPDTVLCMAMQGEMLAMGYKREYSLMSMDADQVIDVPVPVEGINPLLVRCAPGELLLATTNNMGFFVNFEGEPMPKAPLLWSHTPVAIHVCGGYVLALLPGEIVAIFSLLDQKLVQQVKLGKSGAAAVAASTSLLMSSYPNGDLVLCCISSSSGSTDVYSLYLTSLNDQIEQYMELGLATEAEALLHRLDPTPAQRAEFHLQAGFVLMKELEWEQAFEQHFPKATDLDPRELIALFPDLTLPPMPYQSSWANKMGSIHDIIERAKKKAAAMPPGDAKINQASRMHVQNTSTTQLARQARMQLARYLWNWRCSQRQQADSKRQDSTRRGAGVGLGAHIPSSADVEVGVCVDTALLYLYVELEEWRLQEMAQSGGGSSATKKRTTSDAASAGGALSLTSGAPFTLRQLLFPSNTCLLHESELYLSRHRQYNALALLFQSKGAIRKALEVWKNMGEGKFQMKQGATIVEEDEEEGGRTRRSSRGRSSSTHSSSSAPGVSETVSLLSSLSDQPLLWEFAEWVITGWPYEGLKIFLSTARAKEEQLQPEKVLTFLKRVQTNIKASAQEGTAAAYGGMDGDFTLLPTAAHLNLLDSRSPPPSSAASLDLVESYLEYLVGHEKTTEVKYHTQLALCYLKKVISLQLPVFASSAAGTNNSKGGAGAGKKPRSGSFTSSSSHSGASGLSRFKPGHEPGLLGPPRLKLFKFLQQTKLYDAQLVLNTLVNYQTKTGSSAAAAANRNRATTVMLPSSSNTQSTSTSTPSSSPRPSYSGLDLSQHASNLYEEVLLLYSRLGQHRRVMQIYVFDLLDEGGAANYAHYICQTRMEAERKKKERRAKRGEEEEEEEEDEEATPSSSTRKSNPSSSRSGEGAAGPDGTSTSSGSSLEDGHPGDVFLSLLDLYFSKEYEQLCAERNELLPPEEREEKGVKPQDATLSLLHTSFHLMEPVSLLRILPPTLPLHTLQPLFSRLFPSLLHQRRHGHVVSGLHKMVHLRVQTHAFALRSLHLTVDSSIKCGWCYKALNDSVFVAHPYHAVRDALEKAYLIDFEHGGENTSLAEAIDSDQLIHEMPRFVLVHFQCSAPFVANGGVEALIAGREGPASPRNRSATTLPMSSPPSTGPMFNSSGASNFTRPPASSVYQGSSSAAASPFGASAFRPTPLSRNKL